MTELSINSDKTKTFDLRRKTKRTKNYELTLLGYKFCFGWKQYSDKMKNIRVKPKTITVKMSEAKLNRYKQKIELAFENYKDGLKKYPTKTKGISQTLNSRIRFLTTNFRLKRRKDNVFLGVYFSNEFLTQDLSDLKILDQVLKNEIGLMPKVSKSDLAIVRKLDTYSFEKGFKERIFSKFNDSTFKNDKFLNIWKNL